MNSIYNACDYEPKKSKNQKIKTKSPEKIFLFDCTCQKKGLSDEKLLANYRAVITGLTIEKVHSVTFNTINFDPLIDASIQRHAVYD